MAEGHPPHPARPDRGLGRRDGGFAVVAAIRLREEIEGVGVLALSGLLSVLLGLGLIMAPAVGTRAVVRHSGADAIASGVLRIASHPACGVGPGASGRRRYEVGTMERPWSGAVRDEPCPGTGSPADAGGATRGRGAGRG